MRMEREQHPTMVAALERLGSESVVQLPYKESDIEFTIAGMKVPKDTFNNDYKPKAKPRTFWEVLLDDKEVY